jgi:hypothetical protein
MADLPLPIFVAFLFTVFCLALALASVVIGEDDEPEEWL